MKKLINLVICILTFTIVTTTDAKRLVTRTIPVTKNEKQLFLDTKNLKNAITAEEKIAAANEVATDIQKNPQAQLLIKEQVLLKEIKELEDKINQESSYISYFDTEETTEDKTMLEYLYNDLETTQKQLNKVNTVQRRTTSLLNNWAVKTLIATVGLAIADQLISGGKVREAIISGAGTAAGKIGSGLKTGWSYVPSLKISAGDVGLAAAQGTWEIVKSAGMMVITQKVANQLMQLLEDPNTDESEKQEIRKTLAEWEAEKAEQKK